jgi:2,3-bisphosphoglycerate-dependent phosphoglycerate mutase
VTPYWTEVVAPALTSGSNVLVAAHGNSLRAIVKLLFAVSDAEIPGVEIPTGNPLLIELDAKLAPTNARYLDPARAQPLPGRVLA